MILPVYVLNGPNLNLLGMREPEIYGRATLADIEQAVAARAKTHGLDIVFRQSNHEGVLVDWIHEARAKSSGVIVNPGAYSHTSIAIYDAFKALDKPIVEVHLSIPISANPSAIATMSARWRKASSSGSAFPVICSRSMPWRSWSRNDRQKRCETACATASPKPSQVTACPMSTPIWCANSPSCWKRRALPNSKSNRAACACAWRAEDRHGAIRSHGCASAGLARHRQKTRPPEPARRQGTLVTSPMVGTVYLSPQPGTPAFVKIGDSVTDGTLCIIEAMKTMNPVPSPVAAAASPRSMCMTDSRSSSANR